MRGSRPRTWIKLHVNGMLNGSVRYQLSPAERSVWVDLLVLAATGPSPGIISDNDQNSFPRSFIANRLNVPLKLLNATLSKCEQEGRITITEGVIKISNWSAYQSEYDRQLPYRQKADLKSNTTQSSVHFQKNENERSLSSQLPTLPSQSAYSSSDFPLPLNCQNQIGKVTAQVTNLAAESDTPRLEVDKIRLEEDDENPLNPPKPPNEVSSESSVGGEVNPSKVTTTPGNQAKTSPVPLDPDLAEVSQFYDNNIATLTPYSGAALADALKLYKKAWIIESMEIAVAQNKRRWSYCKGILERWATEGKNNGSKPTHNRVKGAEDGKVESSLASAVRRERKAARVATARGENV